MRSSVRHIALFLIIVLLFSLISCDVNREYCEIGIVLSGEYKEYDADGTFDVAYSNGEMIVGILRFSTEACLEEGIPITMTPLKFADFYKNNIDSGDNATATIEHGDVPYFTYIKENGGIKYLYTPTFYKSYYAYFLIMFITPESLSSGYRVKIFDFVDTVYFMQN